MADQDLLLRVEHVKYRSDKSTSKSPIGVLFVYQDRVEWVDNASPDKLTVTFNEIRGQRVSPPNKTKVQLQLCLHNDDQATFVFLNPAGRETHVKERDLVKETLQQSLIRHRQLANQAAAKFKKNNRSNELITKKSLLESNKHLQQLYKHLVASHLISAQDFWSEYYKSTEAGEDEKLGVSGGFLSSIAQSEGANGVKLNLNIDTIQSIFKTYPAVEKKHLELVPHEMTEQQFWGKFFQSHYFHRERAANPNPSDPFSDCIKTDDIDMHKLLDGEVSNKTLDFAYLDDGLDFTDDHAPVPISSSARSAKSLLVRRCNYHSGRVLLTTHDNSAPSEEEPKVAEDQPSTSTHGEESLQLESAELRDTEAGKAGEVINIAEETRRVKRAVYPEEQANRYANAVLQALSDCRQDYDADDDLDELMDVSSSVVSTDSSKFNGSSPCELSARELDALRVVHDAVAELLKHFWLCFPPFTPELEEKITRMEGTLKKYRTEHLLEAEKLFGRKYVEHCYLMIDKALERYQVFCEKRKR
ncbi:hypothetical protein AB6A40_002852 [Gnathostoma spinigerum]|uniref:BSD domain-containing protein n=1 Tax=Gnathostoma spinigerum TaxID=75299 RepID=A0ABD6E7Y0_9BILA